MRHPWLLWEPLKWDLVVRDDVVFRGTLSDGLLAGRGSMSPQPPRRPHVWCWTRRGVDVRVCFLVSDVVARRGSLGRLWRCDPPGSCWALDTWVRSGGDTCSFGRAGQSARTVGVLRRGLWGQGG